MSNEITLTTIDTTPTNYNCLTVLRTVEQVVNGVVRETIDGYAISGLPTVKSVCDAVVRRVQELDTHIHDKRISPHRTGASLNDQRAMTDEEIHKGAMLRLPNGYEVGNAFFAHAMVRVRDNETAKDAAEYLNKKFRDDRGIFPRDNGWHAEVVTGESMSCDFDNNHPFFRYKETGKMDSKCSRIIIVVDLATEGMNNKYLLVEGIARIMHSTKMSIQSRGRLMRSAAKWKGIPGVSKLIVPPEAFDRIYVITHEAYQSETVGGVKTNVDVAEESLEFIENMAVTMGSVMTLSQYIDEDFSFGEDEDNWVPKLTFGDYLSIAQKVGIAIESGRKAKIEPMIDSLIGKKAKLMVRRYYRALIESAISNRPAHYTVKRNGSPATEQCLLSSIIEARLPDEPPSPKDILISEKLHRRAMNEKECREWLIVKGIGDFDKYVTMEGSVEAAIAKVNHLDNFLFGRHNKVEININETPAARVQRIVDDLINIIDADQAEAAEIKRRTEESVLQYLGNMSPKDMSDLAEDGRLFLPQITYELRNPALVSHIQGWVVRSMLADGLIKGLHRIVDLRQAAE